MAGGQISQKTRDFVVIIHKSRPIVKSRASGGYRWGIAPVQIAQKLPVQTVAVCGYFEPLAAVVFAAALLHETMQPLQILGAVLILCGAAGAECVPMLLQRHQKC